MRSFLVHPHKAESVNSHERDILISWQISLAERINQQTCAVFFFIVLDSVALAIALGSAHPKSHYWPATVLDSCITSELDQVRPRQHVRDVVSDFTNLCNLVGRESQVSTVNHLLLVFEHQRCHWSSFRQVSRNWDLPVLSILIDDQGIVQGSSEHDWHAGRTVEEVKEWFFGNMVQIHYCSP